MTLSNNPNENNLLKGYNMLLNFAGSMVMHEPSENVIDEFWNQGILKRLPVSSNNPRFILAASMLRNSCSDNSQCVGKIRSDFNRLFNSNSSSLAPAYESIYKEIDNMMSGKEQFEVKKFYHSYGLTSKFKDVTPDDHLGTELLFLTMLIDKYLSYDDRFCKAEMKSEIRRFLQQHLLSWVPVWNERVQANSQTECYKGIGTLIHACAEDIYQVLE